MESILRKVAMATSASAFEQSQRVYSVFGGAYDEGVQLRRGRKDPNPCSGGERMNADPDVGKFVEVPSLPRYDHINRAYWGGCIRTINTQPHKVPLVLVLFRRCE